MAPRRKVGRPDITTRLKNRPPCRALCKPCCYAFVAITVLIGLIVLVVILVSLFPLPIDRLKNWIMKKTSLNIRPVTLLPCSDVRVTKVWSMNLPKLTSESPIRTLDINQDDVEDIIFGFGTGETAILQSDIFCPVFMGIAPPCEGGVIALDGTNGTILWRHWMNDTIFSLSCSADIDKDGIFDCLIVGKKGTLAVINSKNGIPIWRVDNNPDDIFLSNFVLDLDNDTVPDVLSSHSQYNEGTPGHLILMSGKSGKEIRRVEIGYTLFMPQIFWKDGEYYVLFGNGGPRSAGNLSLAPLVNIFTGNMTAKTVYADAYKGMLTQSVLVDITGDNQKDIITAMYNSTVVAINGQTLEQIWNFTTPNSESLIVPTPGYFNDDNVTDFLVIYQQLNEVNNSIFTKTFIIDGKTGKAIYEKPILGSIETQMGALTLRMDNSGFDAFIFWTKEHACRASGGIINNETRNSVFECSEPFNSSVIVKLNVLNPFTEPPGFEIYNSEKYKEMEHYNVKSSIEEAIEFLQQREQRPPVPAGLDDNFQDNPVQFKHVKYKGGSNFRHKDNQNGLIREFTRNDLRNKMTNEQRHTNFNQDYGLPGEDINSLIGENMDPLDYSSYAEDPSSFIPNRKPFLDDSNLKLNARDPRSKVDMISEEPYTTEFISTTPEFTTQESNIKPKQKTQKKNLADKSKYGMYDYRNIYNARNRLLHDLSNLPSDILRDTYYKNRERQLRKSRFEQRDLKSHKDRMKENQELMKVIEKEKETYTNVTENLWDLESEKEMEDKQNGYYRGKREINYTAAGTVKITSVGALTKSRNSTGNSVDIIFLTYWLPQKRGGQQALDTHLENCVNGKLTAAKYTIHNYDKVALDNQEAIFMRECSEEYKIYEKDFPYFTQTAQLALGQMTVYRLRIECSCQVLRKEEKCTKFLPIGGQGWSSYMGKAGNGLFEN